MYLTESGLHGLFFRGMLFSSPLGWSELHYGI